MLHAYSIFDKKTASYACPVWARHLEEVVRSLRIELEDPKSTYARFAADFVLFRIGHFEQDTGALVPTVHAPEPVCELAALFTQIPPKGE